MLKTEKNYLLVVKADFQLVKYLPNYKAFKTLFQASASLFALFFFLFSANFNTNNLKTTGKIKN